MAASAVLNIVKRVSGLLSSEWKHNRAGQEVKWDFLHPPSPAILTTPCGELITAVVAVSHMPYTCMLQAVS